ncbi:MAG: hypothetical protein O2807_12440 [bacterium]|nr:hypothetical protein [bacterium]
MMRFPGKLSVWIFGALVLAVGIFLTEAPRHPAWAASAGSEKSIEVNVDGYPVPVMARAKFLGWVRRDLTDRIPGKETLFKQYADEWGFAFEVLSINNVVFAINLDTDGRYPYDITLMDTNCDGIFETKIEEKPGEKVDEGIPECVFRAGVPEK